MEPLRIAVCEDSPEEQEKLFAILEQSEIPTETATFASGEDFLNTYQIGKYDLLLMDIYMGGMTGIEVVTELRKTDETLIVAFTTTSTEHTLAGYRLNAIKYIEKPVQKKAVLELLQFAQLKKESTPRLALRVGGKECSQPFARILYVEQMDHTLYFYLTGGEVLETTGKLDKIEEQFAGQPFFRCHKSYLVNLAHVIELDKWLMLFVMEEGKSVYIRRESLGKAKKAYEAYLFAAARELGDGE